MQGNLLAMTAAEARWLTLVFAGILAVHVALFKEFLYLSFDPVMATTQGYRAGRWSLAFYLLLGGAIALAIKAIGILLMFAFLVIPATLGLIVTRRLGAAFALAMLSAAAAVYLGTWLSYRYDFPSAPMIIAALGGLLVIGLAGRAVVRR